MDAPGINMYVLGMVRSLVPRSRLVLQSRATCKLGQVSLSGYIRHGGGISLTNLRVFGNYALVYLLEGSGRMKIGGGAPFACRAGDLLFVYPEIPHGYGPGPGEIWSEFYVVFNGPVFDLWRRSGFLQPQRPVQRLAAIRRWLPQLEAVAQPGIPNNPEGMLRRVCLLQKFLSDILETPATTTPPTPWLEESMRLLTKVPGVPQKEIARALGVSHESFRKEFTRLAGLPPTQYRLHRLIEQARELITERNLSNKQLAETLGFYDEFHLSRRFRQVTGRSTREFRRKLRTGNAR